MLTGYDFSPKTDTELKQQNPEYGNLRKKIRSASNFEADFSLSTLVDSVEFF